MLKDMNNEVEYGKFYKSLDLLYASLVILRYCCQ